MIAIINLCTKFKRMMMMAWAREFNNISRLFVCVAIVLWLIYLARIKYIIITNSCNQIARDDLARCKACKSILIFLIKMIPWSDERKSKCIQSNGNLIYISFSQINWIHFANQINLWNINFDARATEFLMLSKYSLLLY